MGYKLYFIPYKFDHFDSLTNESYTSGLGSSDFSPSSQTGSAPYFYKYSQPLCPKCATCKICAPMPISKLSGNTVPNFMPRANPVYQTNISDDSINLSDHSGSRTNSLPTQKYTERCDKPERNWFLSKKFIYLYLGSEFLIGCILFNRHFLTLYLFNANFITVVEP